MSMIISYILSRKIGIHNSEQIIKGGNSYEYIQEEICGNFCKVAENLTQLGPYSKVEHVEDQPSIGFDTIKTSLHIQHNPFCTYLLAFFCLFVSCSSIVSFVCLLCLLTQLAHIQLLLFSKVLSFLQQVQLADRWFRIFISLNYMFQDT